MPFSFGSEILNEGSFAQLSCVVTEGDEPLTVSWSFHGDTSLTSNDLVTRNFGPRTSLLMIQSVGHRHMGSYTCSASNAAGNASFTAHLKVNGTNIIYRS